MMIKKTDFIELIAHNVAVQNGELASLFCDRLLAYWLLSCDHIGR